MTAPALQLGLLPQTWPTIITDDPWPYDDAGIRGGIGRHYKPLSIARIKALPVHELAWSNAHMYLWTTNSFLEAAFGVMRARGFDYKTTITWDKGKIGTGHYFRGQTEHCLFGVRGRAPLLVHNLPTIIRAPRGEHSAKPEEFFRMVEKASPGPYLSVFEREDRGPGWSGWGNQMPGGGISLPALEKAVAA